MIYTVKHSHANPRNNTRVECTLFAAAIVAAKVYAGEPVDSTIYDETGKAVAFRLAGETHVTSAQAVQS